jgi:hypothetical protein
MQIIPKSILLEFFKYLNPREIFKLRIISKYWNEIILNLEEIELRNIFDNLDLILEDKLSWKIYEKYYTFYCDLRKKINLKKFTIIHNSPDIYECVLYFKKTQSLGFFLQNSSSETKILDIYDFKELKKLEKPKKSYFSNSFLSFPNSTFEDCDSINNRLNKISINEIIRFEESSDKELGKLKIQEKIYIIYNGKQFFLIGYLKSNTIYCNWILNSQWSENTSILENQFLNIKHEPKHIIEKHDNLYILVCDKFEAEIYIITKNGKVSSKLFNLEFLTSGITIPIVIFNKFVWIYEKFDNIKCWDYETNKTKTLLNLSKIEHNEYIKLNNILLKPYPIIARFKIFDDIEIFDSGNNLYITLIKNNNDCVLSNPPISIYLLSKANFDSGYEIPKLVSSGRTFSNDSGSLLIDPYIFHNDFIFDSKPLKLFYKGLSSSCMTPFGVVHTSGMNFRSSTMYCEVECYSHVRKEGNLKSWREMLSFWK